MLQTENLRLIPAAVELAEALADYYRRNRAFLRPFEPERPEIYFTVDYQKELLAKQMKDAEEKTDFRFYLQPIEEPHRIIGSIALNNVIWGPFCSAFLGYKLDAEYLNRGYMTAAVGVLTQYAFSQLGLHRLEANVMPRNRASLRVLEKNGYENEGLAKRYLHINGVWEDHIHMVKRSDDER